MYKEMKHFDLANEPADFDKGCRKPGELHRKEGADTYWRDYWSDFRPALAEAFGWLCGYSVVRLSKGTVDHFWPKGNDPKSDSPYKHLVYEWSNFRFCDGDVNNLKRKKNPGMILDPFEVQDGWFEIALPSLRLQITSEFPNDVTLRARAEFTMEKLELRDGPAIMRLREDLYNQFLGGHVDIHHVRFMNPLLADAIEKQNALL